MTDRTSAIQACMRLKNVYEDYPFDDDNWTAMRHRENGKIFALIFFRNGDFRINLKALPQMGAVWRQQFPRSVFAAYHMNKMHWIGVLLDGSLSDELIFSLISDSYVLTLPASAKSRLRAKK